MSQPAFREKMHGKDSRIVKKTIVGTRWTDLISILSVGPMFFFALIGIGAMCVDRERRRHLSLLCLIILSFAAGYAFFYGRVRYRIPIEPYILMLSAYGLTQMWAMLARPTRTKAPHAREEPDATKVSRVS